MLFGLDRLKKLQEEQFGNPDDENSDYTLDANLNDDDAENPPPTEEGGEAQTDETTTGEEEIDDETPPDENEGEETPPDEEGGGDDYTMDNTDDTDGGEGGEDGENTTGDSIDDETTMEEDNNESQDNIKQKEKLLDTFKKFYDDVSDLSINIGDRISPLNQKEEFLYKIIVNSLESTKNLLYTYITDIFGTQNYETNLYQLYYFSSQIEMVQILLKKIRTYREDMKNNIIKK